MTLAEEIIGSVSKDVPADRALKVMFKDLAAAPEFAEEVSNIVFTYYRWYGFGKQNLPVWKQLEDTLQFESDYQPGKRALTEADIRKILPEWIFGQVDGPTDWPLAFQVKPPLWIRAKADSVEKVVSELNPKNTINHFFPTAFEYRGKQNLFKTVAFNSGLFEIQDIASQAVGHLCQPGTNETWLDACSGEGGKTLHLSDLMGNKGLIWAIDRSIRRLTHLKKRAGRAGAFNYRVAEWTDPKRLPMKTLCHGALVDAPCSGVGTWGRNPHARWTITQKDITELATIQRELLNTASKAVKPGGKLVYSVCTLTRMETSGVADSFSEENPGFKRVALPHLFGGTSASNLYLWPKETRGNGMFVSAWIKDE
ncbi:MAG: methyltransferase [Verrucomicrobiales bacterium]|nr:methyltransferase [Verrucomicrobiales bacterium]